MSLFFARNRHSHRHNAPPKPSGPTGRNPLSRLGMRRLGVEPRTYGLRVPCQRHESPCAAPSLSHEPSFGAYNRHNNRHVLAGRDGTGDET